MKRPNLTIVTQAQATGIGFEGKRAVSVAYRRNGQVETARAGREIILSAGAIGSPQLLQLSGVGPAALLQRYGIAPLQDSPAVGRHMQDHLCYDHVYRANQPSLNEILRPWAGRLKIGLQYLLTRRGPLSLSVNQGGGFARSRPDATRPDIQFYFAPLSFDQTPPGKRIADPFPGFYLSLSPCRPVSRGYVEIRSTDPDQAPAIQPNILAEPEDAAVALAGARWLEKLARQPGLARIIDAELKPGLPERSDAAVLADIRARAYSVFHPCGSCRMGPDPAQAAVDAKLRVHGLAGLRVIDASVFPYVTAGNINAPSIAVGGRGADLILAEA